MVGKVDMVISWVQGGIGNQMFQYAAGRALSIATKQPFYVDLQDFKGYALHHGFELNEVFNLRVEVADEQLLNAVLDFRNQCLIRKLIKRPLFKLMRGSQFILEPHFQYWPQFENLTSNCYLYGYWQSEKYFQSIKNAIQTDFQFRQALDSQNELLAREMRATVSVSVHIRRGDYLSDAKTAKVMHICDLGYYQRAVEYMSKRLINPVFYIFSDDILWAKEQLSIPYQTRYVEHNLGKESYRDMQLMSLCKNQIIANSSFSWWGAWLNSNPDKLVIAPQKWFVNNNNDQDLIPDKWIRL
jgi:hypothetical protein